MKMKSAIIVARHGERIDYYIRDNGGNWLQEPSNERPWDPPLTYRGQMQARRLGSYLHKLIQQHNLPPLEAVYSSPLTRCCMTAGEAIIGYQQESQAESSKNKKEYTSSDLKVHIETGLVESLNEKWYRSWCLKDSDGTWGGKDGDKYQNGVFPPSIQESDVHSKAKIPSRLLFQSKQEICEYLQNYQGHVNDASLDCLNGSNHKEFQSSSSIVSKLLESQEKEIFSPTDNSHQWNNFESRKVLQDRVTAVANELSRKHPGKTILLVSHGSPVTRLYESLSGNDWKAHGVSTYTSFSIYQSKDLEEGTCTGWQALRANDNTHVEEMHMESADQKAAW